MSPRSGSKGDAAQQAAMDAAEKRAAGRKPRGRKRRPTGEKRQVRRTPVQWATSLRGLRYRPSKGGAHLVAVLLSWVCVAALVVGAVLVQTGATGTSVLIAGGTAASSAVGAHQAAKRAGVVKAWKNDPVVRHHNVRMGRDATDDGGSGGTTTVRAHRNDGHAVTAHTRRAAGSGPAKGGVSGGQRSGTARGGRPA